MVIFPGEVLTVSRVIGLNLQPHSAHIAIDVFIDQAENNAGCNAQTVSSYCLSFSLTRNWSFLSVTGLTEKCWPMISTMTSLFYEGDLCSPSSHCHPSTCKEWWEEDRRIFKLRPCCFHVVTGHMGCLCSPETIWICVCVFPQQMDYQPSLWMQSFHRWELKNLPFERKTSSATEVRRSTDVHISRIIVAQWAHSPSVCKLHFWLEGESHFKLPKLAFPEDVHQKKNSNLDCRANGTRLW